MILPQVSVPGASCAVVSGQTVMRFQRSLAADSATEIQVTPGTDQMVTWRSLECVVRGGYGDGYPLYIQCIHNYLYNYIYICVCMNLTLLDEYAMGM